MRKYGWGAIALVLAVTGLDKAVEMERSPETQNLLIAKLSEVIPFAESLADDKGAIRVASKNGHVAVEFLPAATVVFVQTQAMGAINLAQHSAILVLTMQRYFPQWDAADGWLDMALSSTALGVSHHPPGNTLSVLLRKTRLGIFLEIR